MGIDNSKNAGRKTIEWYESPAYCKIIGLIMMGYDTRKKIMKLNQFQILGKPFNVMPQGTLNIYSNKPSLSGSNVLLIDTEHCSKHNKKYSINWLVIRDFIKKLLLEELESFRKKTEREYLDIKGKKDLYIELQLTCQLQNREIKKELNHPKNKKMSKKELIELFKKEGCYTGEKGYIDDVKTKKNDLDSLNSNILKVTELFNQMDFEESERLFRFVLSFEFLNKFISGNFISFKEFIIRCLNLYGNMSSNKKDEDCIKLFCFLGRQLNHLEVMNSV